MSNNAEQFLIGQPVDLGDLVELPLGVVRAVHYFPRTKKVSYTVLVVEQVLPNGPNGERGTLVDVAHEALTEAVGINNAYEGRDEQEFLVGTDVTFVNSLAGQTRREIIGLKNPIIAADDAKARAMHGSRAVIVGKTVAGDTFDGELDDSRGTLIRYFLWFPSSPDCVISHFPLCGNEFSVYVAPPLTTTGFNKVVF